MDSVLDFLFLRRLKLEYISPPVCPFPIVSATGLSIPIQSICPLAKPDAPTVGSSSFLIWGIEQPPAGCCTNVVCYNLYQQIDGTNNVPVSECQPPNSITVCSAGSWQVSAVFSTGMQSPFNGPFISDGVTPLNIPLPFSEGVVRYEVLKNGNLVLNAFMSAGFEVCDMPACFALSQITSDGETSLSGPVCISQPTPPPPPVDHCVDFIENWAARVVAHSGAAPSASTKAALVTFYCGLIADGLETKVLAWNAIVPDNLTAAVTPQKVGTGLDPWTMHNIVSGDLTINGITGNAADKYLDTGIIPAAIFPSPQNGGQVAYVFNTTGTGVTSGTAEAVMGTDSWLEIIAKWTDTQTYSRIGTFFNQVIVASSPGAGCYSQQRVNNVDHRLFFANSTNPPAQIGGLDSIDTPNALFNATPAYLLCLNFNSVASFFSTDTISFWAVTAGLTPTENAALFHRIQTLRVSLGGGFI